ncbi:MAG: hypothetical protein M3417_16150, partial [Actinomycetota bacterium]|nr:hypothetical protein [Actinomycetota bacterium]
MLRPFGLRARLLLALVATAMATLLVAALALFSPLQQRLREQQASGLQAAGRTARPQVEAAIRRDLREAGDVALETSDVLRDIQSRSGAQAAVTDVTGEVLAGSLPLGDDLEDVNEVLAANSTTPSRTEDRQRIALPLDVEPASFDELKNPRFPFYVLALRQPDTQIAETVSEVRQAFVTAAVVGLEVAVLLGLFLTTTLTRRLARLRDAAVRITTDAMNAPTPMDDGSDEVGDLA